MKKEPMAEAAESLLAATGWLPPLLRTPGQATPQAAAEGEAGSSLPDAAD